MTKVLVLFYSTDGHIEKLAHAIADGAREVGTDVDIKRVPEMTSDEALKQDRGAPVVEADGLVGYDAIILGTPSCAGCLGQEMTSFLTAADNLGVRGTLQNTVAGAFTSADAEDGGQEKTLIAIITHLLNFGMIVVGHDYGPARQTPSTDVTIESPFGSSTITSGAGTRMPWDSELASARCQGRRIAEIAKRLAQTKRADNTFTLTPQAPNAVELTTWLAS